MANTTMNPYWDAIKDVNIDNLYGMKPGNYTIATVDFGRASRLFHSRFDYCRKYS